MKAATLEQTDMLPPVDGDLMPPIDERDFVAPEEKGMPWNSLFTRLPSTHCMLESDLKVVGRPNGLIPGEREDLAKRAQAGDKDAQRIIDQICEVYVEMMHRTRERRHKKNNMNRHLYEGPDGKPTEKRFVISDSGTIEHTNPTIWEQRSVFGLNQLESSTAPGQKPCFPGYHVKQVRDNFTDLLPKLEFKTVAPDLPPADYPVPGAIEYAKGKHAKNVLDDASIHRRNLLAWLKPFLKNKMTSAYDGIQ
jgi:hypothetical protein